MIGIQSYVKLLPPEVREQVILAHIELELKGAALPPPAEDCELCGIAQAKGEVIWCSCVKRKVKI